MADITRDDESQFSFHLKLLQLKRNNQQSQQTVCELIRDELLSSDTPDSVFRRYHRLFRDHSSYYRSLNPSSPTTHHLDAERWQQFHARATALDRTPTPGPAPSTNSNPNRPVLDPVFSQEWVTKVINQTKNRLEQHDQTHYDRTARQILNFLTHGRPPTATEINLCDTREAMHLVGSGTKVVVTQNQAPIYWGDKRPTESLFTWYTSAQLTAKTDNPDELWNVLNLPNPIQARQPDFLCTPNHNLLKNIPTDDLKKCGRDVANDFLLGEGGVHTSSHIDNYGFGVFITVYEGTYGFGWLDTKTSQDRQLWEQNPLSTAIGKSARYIVIKPGQTVFFPPGTIHFVFRALNEPTLAMAGDVVSWSCIMKWLRVLKIQYDNLEQYSSVEKSTIIKWMKRLKKLIKNEIKADKSGSTDTYLSLIGGNEEAKKILDTIDNWDEFNPDMEI